MIDILIGSNKKNSAKLPTTTCLQAQQRCQGKSTGVVGAGQRHSIEYIKGKGSPYSIIERRVPELITVLGSQPAGDVSHKPGGRLPLLSARPAVTPATLKRAATNFAAWRTEAQWV